LLADVPVTRPSWVTLFLSGVVPYLSARVFIRSKLFENRQRYTDRSANALNDLPHDWPIETSQSSRDSWHPDYRYSLIFRHLDCLRQRRLKRPDVCSRSGQLLCSQIEDSLPVLVFLIVRLGRRHV
jgi:hypothetical protein